MTSDENNERGSLKPKWGLLPADVLESLKVRYWHNRRKLKSLLNGDAEFPLEVPLKPPKGNAAIQNISHFQKFVSSWKFFFQELSHSKSKRCEVKWESRNFRSLAEQDIPTRLTISDIGSLAFLIGASEERQLQDWLSKIKYIFDSLSLELSSYADPYHQTNDSTSTEGSSTIDKELFQALIDHLETLDSFDQTDLELLVKLIPQLQKGMGEECYLRALPIIFVDTKFIEKNLRIIESITAALIDSAAKEVGLMSWLDCREKPKDWLLVKPLCEETRKSLGGAPLLRLSSDTLHKFELPASNILVIENEQSCLALNNVPNTIAVSGGGKNVAWMKAKWLTLKKVGYWGDIDSEGFSILSDARSKLSSITPLMMDELTVETFAERMVPEPDSVSKDPIALTDKELALFKSLRADHYVDRRLEQERLPMEYVAQNIEEWLV